MNKKFILIICALCLAGFVSKELSSKPSDLSIRSVIMMDQKEKEPLKTDLKVKLSNPKFPSVVTTKGDVATINFESNKSLEGKKLVLKIYFPVGMRGVGGIEHFIYKGESVVKLRDHIAGKYTMTSDKQGKIKLVISTPRVSGPPSFLLRGKRSITIKLMLQEGKKEILVSNVLSVELEFK